MPNSNKVGFLVDLPMVFSVVHLDDLIKNANEYYNSNIFVPKVGSFGVSKDEMGNIKRFYLYKLTGKKLDEIAQETSGEIGSIKIDIEKIGTFKSLYDLMNEANSTTIFQSVDEANLFLRAILKTSDKQEYNAYLCLDNEIETH